MNVLYEEYDLSACFCKSTNIPWLGKVFARLYFDKFMQLMLYLVLLLTRLARYEGVGVADELFDQ